MQHHKSKDEYVKFAEDFVESEIYLDTVEHLEASGFNEKSDKILFTLMIGYFYVSKNKDDVNISKCFNDSRNDIESNLSKIYNTNRKFYQEAKSFLDNKDRQKRFVDELIAIIAKEKQNEN